MDTDDTRDWQVVDRLADIGPFNDLQYKEAIDLAREKSAKYAPLMTMKQGEPNERFVVQINIDKVRARLHPSVWCPWGEHYTENFTVHADGDWYFCKDCGKGFD